AMRWSAETCAVVSLVGRDPALLLRELAPGRRVLVLSSDEHTPRQVAQLLTDAEYGASELTVLGDLGGPAQSSALFDNASILTGRHFDFPRLNVVAVELAGPHRGGWVAGLPDEAFEH